MRCGTIVYRNADGSPGEAVDFVASDKDVSDKDVSDKISVEPADEVIDWLLEEFLEYRKKQTVGSTEQLRV